MRYLNKLYASKVIFIQLFAINYVAMKCRFSLTSQTIFQEWSKFIIKIFSSLWNFHGHFSINLTIKMNEIIRMIIMKMLILSIKLTLVDCLA